jgi:hypothetical protein
MVSSMYHFKKQDELIFVNETILIFIKHEKTELEDLYRFEKRISQQRQHKLTKINLKIWNDIFERKNLINCIDFMSLVVVVSGYLIPWLALLFPKVPELHLHICCAPPQGIQQTYLQSLLFLPSPGPCVIAYEWIRKREKNNISHTTETTTIQQQQNNKMKLENTDKLITIFWNFSSTCQGRDDST